MHKATLHNAQQGYQAMQEIWHQAKAHLMAGQKMVLTLDDYEGELLEGQRKYYHGILLQSIAEQVQIEGKKHGLGVWKEYFRDKYLGYRSVAVTNPLTGKRSRRRQRVSTEELGVRRYAKLIQQVEAQATTELGVRLPARVDQDTGEVMA